MTRWHTPDTTPLFGAEGMTHKACQFIEGHPSDLPFGADLDSLYCGAKVQAGSSYCAEHHARCYNVKTAPAQVIAKEWQYTKTKVRKQPRQKTMYELLAAE
jgi:hypothetical protein